MLSRRPLPCLRIYSLSLYSALRGDMASATALWAELRGVVRKVPRKGVSMAASAVMLHRALFRVVRILYKPPVKRTEDEIEVAAEFIWTNRLSMTFFRNMSRPAITALCRVMSSLVCDSGHVVYDVKVRKPLPILS